MYNTQQIKTKAPLRQTVEWMTKAQFKKVGTWWMVKCPLHAGDDTPSFGIKGDGEVYKCFGCPPESSFGDVIDFTMHYLNLTFQEACQHLGGNVEISAEDLMRLKRERQEENTLQRVAEMAELLARRAVFAAKREWEEFDTARAASPESIKWWESQGIPAEWQKYWKLGAVENLWGLYGKAYSIPYFGHDGPITMQYRIEHVNGAGKYRFEPDLGTSAYITRLDPKFSSRQIIVVEGAKKGMVTHVRGVDAKAQVIGIPQENSTGGDEADRMLQEAKSIIWWPDPNENAQQWAHRHVERLGIADKTRMVKHYMKPDDALLAGLSARQFGQILRQARPMLRSR